MQNDQLEYLINLYTLRRDSLTKRREIEWKVFLSYFSGISILTYFIVGHSIRIPNSLLIVFSIFIVFPFLLWLLNIYNSAKYDHDTLKVYKKEIENLMLISTKLEVVKDRSVEIIWLLSQVVIIITYTFFCIILIQYN